VARRRFDLNQSAERRVFGYLLADGHDRSTSRRRRIEGSRSSLDLDQSQAMEPAA